VLEARPVAAPVTLLIGPPGGFTETERIQAEESGVRDARLGCAVLRTETAAVAAAAVAFACAERKAGAG
jgi:16S rRNA (uracil1498-N3)-methyltransferase